MLRERESAKIRPEMWRPARTWKVLVGAVCMVLLGALASTAIAAAPKPPTLTVRVSPSTVRPGRKYKITISGSYDQKAVRTHPYLIAFIQYSAGACKSTAKTEATLPAKERSWDFDPYQGILVPPSFSRWDGWTAQSRLGTRHVCAYLYARRVSLSSNATPLITASATFHNI
jgi:hypothetical protein